MDKMEELVNDLAQLQISLKLTEDVADEASNDIDCLIRNSEKRIEDLKIKREKVREDWIPKIKSKIEQITEKKMEILDTWDGEKKTHNYDNWVLQLRTTGSLNIRNKAALMEDLITRTSVMEVANKYISGFKLTPIKAYMGVHPLPPSTAEIEYKTSVTLKEK